MTTTSRAVCANRISMQGANATTPSPAVSAIELAYGLLWCMSVNRRAPNGWLASEARKALLAQLDKDGQARGIMAARAFLEEDAETSEHGNDLPERIEMYRANLRAGPLKFRAPVPALPRQEKQP